MKRALIGLMGILTIITLTFGTDASSKGLQIESSINTLADGDTGG